MKHKDEKYAIRAVIKELIHEITINYIIHDPELLKIPEIPSNP